MAQTKAQLLGPVVGDVTMDVSTLSLDSEGNKVGIGTTEADLTLHVNGVNALPSSSGSTPTGHLTLRAKSTSSSHGMFMGVSNAAPWSSWIQAQDANNNATEYPLLLNPNGGDVGIGTTTNYADSLLEVRGTNAGGDVAIRVTNNSTASGTQAGIIFTTTTADYTTAGIGYERGTADALKFYVGQSAGGGGFDNATERLRIASTGKLEVYKGTSTTGKTSGSEALTVGNGAGSHRFAVYPDGSTVIGGTGLIGNNNILLRNDGMILAGAAHFTANITPTSGRGIEIFEASTGVGQISSFDRDNSSWDELRIKSNHLEVFTGSSNKLSARFNTNGSLTLFVNDASHQTHTFTTGGGNAGKIMLYDANGTTDVQLATDSHSWFQGGNLAVGHNSPDCRFHVRKDSTDTNFENENTPSSESGIKIANLSTTVGSWTAVTLSVSNGSATQNGSIIAKSVSGGTRPEIHIGQRNGDTTEPRISVNSSGHVGISNSSPTRALSVSGNMNLSSGSRIESYSSSGNLIIQGGSTYPGGHLKMYGGSGDDKIQFCTTGAGTTSIVRFTLNSNGSIRLTPEGSTGNPNARIDTSGDNLRLVTMKDGSGGCGFILQTQHSGAVGERLRVTTDGKFGFNGNTSPKALIDLGVTSTSSQVLLLRQNGSVSRTGFAISPNYGIRAFGPSDATSTGQLFAVGMMNASDGTTYNGDLFKVRYDGKVGIGVEPQSRLHVTDHSHGSPGYTLSCASGISFIGKMIQHLSYCEFSVNFPPHATQTSLILVFTRNSTSPSISVDYFSGGGYQIDHGFIGNAYISFYASGGGTLYSGINHQAAYAGGGTASWSHNSGTSAITLKFSNVAYSCNTIAHFRINMPRGAITNINVSRTTP